MDLSQLEKEVLSKMQEVTLIRSELNKMKAVVNEVGRMKAVINVLEQRLQSLTGNSECKPLKFYVANALSKSNEPLTANQIVELVLEDGCVTKSKKNFPTIISQVLSNNSEFKRVTRAGTKPARYCIVE